MSKGKKNERVNVHRNKYSGSSRATQVQEHMARSEIMTSRLVSSSSCYPTPRSTNTTSQAQTFEFRNYDNRPKSYGEEIGRYYGLRR